MIVRLAVITLAFAGAVPVRAQTTPVRDRTLPTLRTTEDTLARRRMYGVLVYTDVTVDHPATPARAAFASLAETLGIALVVRYADDPMGHGIDPGATITLDARSRPALEVLEAMLAQCGTPAEPCTWQLRKGFVELGTKRRLSVPAACDTRLYDIVDLKMHIPDHPLDRVRPDIGALDVVQEICENVEPGVWDYGQTVERRPATPEDPSSPPMRRATEVSGAGANAPARDEATVAAPRAVRRYVAPASIAIIRYWRDVLIIHAPDYIHRQINGYPDPILPRIDSTVPSK